MNINYLEELAKNNPAIARLIEAALVSLVTYALAAVIGQEVFSTQAAVVAFSSPILLALQKRNRDLKKEINE